MLKESLGISESRQRISLIMQKKAKLHADLPPILQPNRMLKSALINAWRKMKTKVQTWAHPLYNWTVASQCFGLQ